MNISDDRIKELREWLEIEAWSLTNPMSVSEWQDRSRAALAYREGAK